MASPLGVPTSTGSTAVRPTLRDVARAAGVSPMTASNAYNRPDQLSPATRDRVLAVADALGYCGPSPAARALRRGRSGVVGVLLTDALVSAFTDPGAVAFLSGLAQEISDHDLSLLLLATAHVAAGVQEATIDALVGFGLPDDCPAVPAALARKLPLVLAGGDSDSLLPVVGVDNRAASRVAAEHLLALGHRRLAVVTWHHAADGFEGPCPPDRQRASRYGVARSRLAGVADALRSAGLDPDAVPVWEGAVNQRESGRKAAHYLLGGNAPPTAIVAGTDVLALGVLQGARELGLDVPGDVSVIGFDDIEEARASQPPLTTIHQDLFGQGRVAARRVLGEEESDTTHALQATELVVRATTAPVSKGNR
jgi:DNA-binding LacI/PurR family transcriptional regulator